MSEGKDLPVPAQALMSSQHAETAILGKEQEHVTGASTNHRVIAQS